MISEITLAKQQLRDALVAAEIDCVEYIPERVIPPLVVINSGSPFIIPETLANGYVMGLELVLVAETATNEFATERLETLIQDVLRALPNYAELQRVDKPFALSVNNAEYFSTNIFVDISITI
jgi:hypothetical protein